MTLKNIIDSFYSNNVDYNEIVNNKDVIIEGKDELIDNIKNPKKDSELTIYSLILLATINDKDSFLNILNLFKIDDLFKNEELIDIYASIISLILFNTFDGNYHHMEDTILNNTDNEYISCLFLAYAYICIVYNKSSKLVNFIKANLGTELYEGFYDDIIDVYLDFQLDSLTVIVKELNLKDKLSSFNGPYYEILDLYLTEDDNIDTSVKSIYQYYSEFKDVKNIDLIEKEYRFYNELFKIKDEIKNYINNNPYDKKTDIKEYLDNYLSNINFDSLYPLKEIRNEITMVEKDINIDYMLYKYFITEEVIYDFDDEESYKFIDAYYSYILSEFKKYLNQNNFTNDDYDNSRSIHFITKDLYKNRTQD